MYKEEVGSTRGGSLSSGSGNIQDNGSKQKKTYYFSKFDLFEYPQQNIAFGKYKIFLNKLIMQLGQDWRIQTNLLLNPSEFGAKQVFQSSLEIWLEINKMKKNKQIKEEDANLNYENIYFQLFLQKLQAKIHHPIEINSLRQLAMGFFISANQIWEQLMCIKQQIPKKGVFRKISETIQSHTIFNPLMVVKQKIFTLFNKKIKMQQSVLSAVEIKNFNRFKENLQQDQLELRFKKINLNEEDLEQEVQTTKKRSRQSNSQVTFEKIPHENPINQTLLQTAYKYIQNIIGNRNKWQVARGFVTNILEINYNKIQERFSPTKKQPSNKDQQINVRVLKPASEFYHNLMVVWLLFKNDSQYKMKFKQYLSRVRSIFGASWRQNYVEATKLFFCNLGKQWDKLLEQNEIFKKADEQIIQIFVDRVKKNMQKQWEEKIVKKQGDFSRLG